MPRIDLMLAEHLNGFLDRRRTTNAMPTAQRADALDPALVRTIDRLDALDDAPDADPAFVNRLLDELMAATARPDVLLGAVTPGQVSRNGRFHRGVLPVAVPGRGSSYSRTVIAQLATAALVVLTLVGSFFAFGPGQRMSHEDRPAIIPALSGTPVTPPAVETLVDAQIPNMPGGLISIMVNRWLFPAERTSVRFPAVHGGPSVLVAAHGGFVASVDGAEQVSVADEPLVMTTEGVLTNPGETEGEAFSAMFLKNFNDYDADPGVAVENPIENHFAETVPAGPNRVVIERLTLPVGAEWPSYTASELEWVGIGPGNLGVTLVGEGESEWTSGKERQVSPHFSAPQLTPGWLVTLRNTGDAPVDVYRLRVTPLAAGAFVESDPDEDAPHTVLVDTQVPNMPGGLITIMVDRWFFPAEPSGLRMPESGGPSIVVAEGQGFVATVDGVDRALTPGEPVVVLSEGALEKTGEAPQSAFTIGFTKVVKSELHDEGVYAENSVEVLTDIIPAGSARVVLERIVLPVGQAFPEFAASDFEWIATGPGELGVTLTGEGASEWTSGKERQVSPHFSAPQLTPGWQVTLRNTGDAPVEVYRLRVTPLDVATPEAEASPASSG